MKYDDEFILAKECAVRAGAYLADTESCIDSDDGKDIKLVNDKQSEEILIEGLKESGIPILSEESGLIENYIDNTGLLWIIDPLDGSANYDRDIKDLACVSVSLWEGKNPILGVINRFQVGEFFTGYVNHGAWLGETVINTSNVTTMDKAIVSTGFPVRRDYSNESLSEFIRMVQRFKKVRMLGTAAIMGAYVAVGRFDAYYEEDIYIWDVAASCAIVKAAGGYINVVKGDDYKCTCGLFANKRLYEEFVNA